jgi:hypothetical protein
MRRRESPSRQPSDYVYVAAYGSLMKSFAFYIRGQQRQAFEDGAPTDAVYFDTRHRRWVALSELKDQLLEALLKKELDR